MIFNLICFFIGDVPDSLKSMVLKLLLIIATGFDNIDDNPLVEHLMLHSLFEPLIQLLCTSSERQQHGMFFSIFFRKIMSKKFKNILLSSVRYVKKLN